MDISFDQILSEFKRQVRLCSGIGPEEMRQIVDQFFKERALQESQERPGPPRDRPKPKLRPTGAVSAPEISTISTAWKAYAEEHSSDLDVNWIRQTTMEAFSAGYLAGYLGARKEQAVG